MFKEYVYVDRKAACSEHLVLKTYLSSSNNFVNVSYLYEMCLAFYLNVDSHSFTNMLRICLCFPPAFLTPFKPLTLQSKCKSLSCFLSMEFYVKNADTLHEQLKLRLVLRFE